MRKVIPILAAGLISAGFLVTTSGAFAADDAAAPEAAPRRPMKERGAMLKEADTNGDGQVSLEEFVAQHEKIARERFKQMDTNADGFLSKEEARPPRGDGEGRPRHQRQGGDQGGAQGGGEPGAGQ